MNNKATHVQPHTKTSQQLVWSPPTMEWLSIHADGSVKQSDSLAAAGGLIRDWTGRCVGAFVEIWAFVLFTRVEIKAAIRGLQVAWREGFHKVLLYLDYTTAINILTSPDQRDHKYFNLVQQLRGLIQ
ncbi:unnamed protein product [Linum trigynum]|uniref:RNase H type-1 domain-containing protein n=1 Tax=Linum trigynum TaxID=586398 RepID=A0AAV2DHD6_9ROSI